MNNILVGNFFSLLGMTSEAVSTTLKTAKRMLIAQSLAQVFWFSGTIVLKGYSGAVQNAVSLLRNLMAIKGMDNKAAEWAVALLGLILGVCLNNIGLIGFLPVIANFQYTLAIFHFKDNERALKTSFLVCSVMFAVFHLSIYNIVGFVSNLVIAATTALVLIRRRPGREGI